MKLWKYSGTYLWITGIIHTVVGLILGHTSYLAIVKSGFVNSIGEDALQGLWFWFLVCGVVLIFMGTTLQYYIRTTQKPAPRFLGWSLLILSVIGCLMIPASGFWLFIPQAIIILVAKKDR